MTGAQTPSVRDGDHGNVVRGMQQGKGGIVHADSRGRNRLLQCRCGGQKYG